MACKALVRGKLGVVLFNSYHYFDIVIKQLTLLEDRTKLGCAMLPALSLPKEHTPSDDLLLLLGKLQFHCRPLLYLIF